MTLVSEAIAAFFDAETERAVRAMWSALAAAGLPSLATDPGGAYPPHITLAAADELDGAGWDGADWNAVSSGIDPLSRAPQTVHLGEPDTFPDDEGVLFLRVRRTPALDRLQRQLVRALARFDLPVGAFYDPSRWQPHCTLAVDASAAEVRAATELLSGHGGIAAQVSAVGIGALTGAGQIFFTPGA
jgi:2'-5' RNA ligase